MGLLEYLIVLGIVMLSLAVYRQLDRNNRSLEKVKRLGDKLMDDMDTVAREKAVQLKDLAIQVEVHQEASRRAIEHLQQAEAGLETKTHHLDELQARIGGYDTALVELINMTQKAEENIGRLREESAYIDKVGRRIRQAAGQMQELQNRLPGMMDEFKAANAQSLNQIQEQVLGTVESRHAILERRVEDADRSAAERIHKMQLLLEEVESDLSHRVEVYRDAFGKIEVDYNRRLDDVAQRGLRLETDALTRLGESIQEHMEERHRSLRGEIENMGARLQEEEQALEQEMLRLRDKSGSWESQMDQTLQGLHGKLLKGLADRDEVARQEVERYHHLVRQSEEGLLGELYAVRDAAKAQAEGIQGELAGLIEEAKGSSRSSLDQFRTELLSWQRDLEQYQHELEVQAQAKSQDQQQLYEHELQTLADRLEDLRTDMENQLGESGRAAQRSLDEFQDGMHRRFEGLEGQLYETEKQTEQKLLQSQEKGQAMAETLLMRISNDVDAKTASMREAIQQRVEDVNASVKASHDQIDASFNDLRSRVDGWIENSQRYMGDLETQLKTLDDSTRQASQEQRETLDAYIEQTRSNLDSWERQLGGRVKELEGFIARSEELVQTEFARLNDEAKSLAGKTSQEMQDMFELSRQDIQERTGHQIDVLRAELETGRQSLEQDYRRMFELIASWEDQGRQRQAGFEQQATSQAESFAQGFHQRMDELEANLEGRNTQLKNDFAKELDDQRAQVERLLSLSRELITETTNLQKDLDDQQQSLQTQFIALGSEVQSGLQDVSRKAFDEREKLSSQFETSLEQLRSTMAGELDSHAHGVQQRMEETAHALAESGKSFQDELAYWKDALESRINELSSLSNGLHKDTLVKVQQQVQDVQKQAQEFYARIQSDLKTGLGEQEGRIANLLASNEEDLKRLSLMGSETQARIKSWQDMLGESTRSMEGDLAQIRQATLESAQEQIASLKSSVLRNQEDALQSLNEGFTRLKSEIHHSRNDVEQDAKFLAQQIEQWKANFQEQLKGLESKSKSLEDEALEGLKERIGALREEAKGLTRKVQEEFVAASQDAQSQVAKQIEAYQTETRKLQSLKLDMDARISDLTADIGKVKVSTKAGMDSLVAETERNIKELRDKIGAELQTRGQHIQELARTSLDQTQNQVLALKAQSDKENEKIYQSMELGRQDVQEKLKALQQEALNMRRDALGSIQERIDSLRDEARKSTGLVKTEVNTILAEYQMQVEKQLKNSEEEFHRIQDLNSTSQLRFQEIQDIFNRAEQMAQKEYDALREKTRTMMEENAQELQKELARQHGELQGLVQQNISGFSDTVSGVRKDMQQDLQLLQGEFTHYKGDLESRFQALGGEAKRLQDELALVVKADLEKVRKQGDTLAQSMHEQVLKGLETQRQNVAALMQQSSEDLVKSKNYNSETQAQMEQIRLGIQSRIGELEQTIKTYSQDSARRIQQVSEEYQQEILGEVEKRLKDYEQEIGYRMEKIETVNDDIDNLEANLRKSMDRLALRLKEDVDKMGAEFRGRHQADVELARKDLETVNLQILGLEKELDALKTRAYDNMSQQLKVFEDEFFVDLKNRSQKMDQKILDWKTQVESMLGAISEQERAERQMLEDSYSNLIKTRLSEMEANFKDRLAKTGQEFESFQASLQERLSSSEQGVQRMQTELKEEVQGLQANTLENVQREFVRMNQDLENRIRSYEREVESRLQKGDQEFRLRQSDLSSLMDTVRNDVSIWQTQVLNQIRSSGDSVQEELVEFKRETDISINDIQNAYAKERDELASSLAVERNQMRKDIADLGDRLQRFNLDFDQKTRETVDLFNRNYQAFLSDMESGNTGLKEEVAEQLGYFRDFVASSRSEFDGMQRKLMTKLDDDLRSTDNTLKDMDKRIKAFVAQTKLFERADILKDSLSDQIEKMRLDLQQIEEQRKAVLDLDSYLSKVRKLAEEANEKIGKLTAEKRRLDSLDEDYKKLINISNVVDQKIAQVTASNDTLTEIQLTLRHLEEVQKEVNGKYERLERKSDIIDATSEGVERSFQQLQDMESQIQMVQSAMRDLPGQVTDLADRVKNLSSSKKDADSALKSVGNLDKVLKDVEARIQELNTSREWIARTETRLNEITKDADDKINLLSALVKKEVAADKQVGAPGGPSQSVREIVLKLAQQGWRVEEIARTTKLSRGEVELIMEMRAR